MEYVRKLQKNPVIAGAVISLIVAGIIAIVRNREEAEDKKKNLQNAAYVFLGIAGALFAYYLVSKYGKAKGKSPSK